MPDDAAAVAVAVVSYAERELLSACLRSLEPDAREGRAEVWVVDNASSDGSADMVRDDFHWVSLIALEENRGYGAAVNLVAERTTTPWLVAANQDVRVEPGALDRLVEAGEAHRRAGAVTPRLIGPNGHQQHSVQPFPTVWLTAVFNLRLHRLSPRLADRLCLEGHWNPRRPREVPWSFAAFLLLRREAFEAVGRFDHEQWLHAEDLDLAWRMYRAGWTTRYEPSAVVDHVGSVATRKAFGDLERRFMAASYAWMARRRGLRVARTVAALNFAGAAVPWCVLALL
ncbi:MAG: glycosyltransferase family 2 protein, partial [Thermoleophilaceae bacterium]|nr:glycosyltransferase family 2 protein [Thermoleophilaceae bacterium]